MSRTYKIRCYRERKEYVRMNHTKRLHQEMLEAIESPRVGHSYDRGRRSGKDRIYSIDYKHKGYYNDEE